MGKRLSAERSSQFLLEEREPSDEGVVDLEIVWVTKIRTPHKIWTSACEPDGSSCVTWRIVEIRNEVACGCIFILHRASTPGLLSSVVWLSVFRVPRYPLRPLHHVSRPGSELQHGPVVVRPHRAVWDRGERRDVAEQRAAERRRRGGDRPPPAGRLRRAVQLSADWRRNAGTEQRHVVCIETVWHGA